MKSNTDIGTAMILTTNDPAVVLREQLEEAHRTFYDELAEILRGRAGNTLTHQEARERITSAQARHADAVRAIHCAYDSAN